MIHTVPTPFLIHRNAMTLQGVFTPFITYRITDHNIVAEGVEINGIKIEDISNIVIGTCSIPIETIAAVCGATVE